MNTPARTSLPVLLAVATLSACGGSGGGDATPDASPDTSTQAPPSDATPAQGGGADSAAPAPAPAPPADAVDAVDADALNARLYRGAPEATVLDVPVIGGGETDNAELRRAVPYEVLRDGETTLDAFWLVRATNGEGLPVANAVGVLTNRGEELVCDTAADFDSVLTDTGPIEYQRSPANPLFVPPRPYGYGAVQVGEDTLARGEGCIAPGESIYVARPLGFQTFDEQGRGDGFEDSFDVLRSASFRRVEGRRDPSVFALDPTGGIVAVSMVAGQGDRFELTLANRADVTLSAFRTGVFVLDDEGLPVYFAELADLTGGLGVGALDPGEETTLTLAFPDFAGSATRVRVVQNYEFRDADG